MPNATSAVPGGVVLDWRHGTIGSPAPCVVCGGSAVCRSPVKNVPCHKSCAEAWIASHARDAAELRQFIRTHTARAGGR